MPNTGEKSRALSALVGPVAARDAETVEHWRSAPPSVHAAAMIELSEYAERMAAPTGLGKDPDEMFPGVPKPRAAFDARHRRERLPGAGT